MKFYVGILAGLVIGAGAVGLILQPYVTMERNFARTPSQPTERRLLDNYVLDILDEAQLALMLRKVQPDLVPDWIDERLAFNATQLHQEFRENTLAPLALGMIVAYYKRNDLAIPAEIGAIDPKSFRYYSARETEDMFLLRLSDFDEYLATRKAQGAGAASSNESPSPGAARRNTRGDMMNRQRLVQGTISNPHR